MQEAQLQTDRTMLRVTIAKSLDVIRSDTVTMERATQECHFVLVPFLRYSGFVLQILHMRSESYR